MLFSSTKVQILFFLMKKQTIKDRLVTRKSLIENNSTRNYSEFDSLHLIRMLEFEFSFNL
jgi:hypothetical protein